MWVIARSARRRPTLMHNVNPQAGHQTMCGLDISPWSRAYFQAPVPQVMCMKCGRFQT